MRKNIYFLLIILVIVGIFALAFGFSRKKPVSNEAGIKKPLTVTVQKTSDSASLLQRIESPAVTAGDQEITLTAGTSGTVTEINFDLGSYVSQNMHLATIDSIGNFSNSGYENLQSSTIQALELTVESAKESYRIAKDVYENDKTYANKKAKNIASLNLDIAKANLKGALDAHFAVSPISGIVTERFVSEGDSIAAGQTLATISKTGLTKVRFYINKEDLASFKLGMKISINEDGKEISGVVSRISPQADPTTRRFLIEAKPVGKTPLIIGSIITVSFEINKVPSSQENLILPLSAITVGQNEKYIFIAQNEKAKKVAVEIINVFGEAAEIKADISSEAQIIMNGSKLVQDGDEIVISNQ